MRGIVAMDHSVIGVRDLSRGRGLSDTGSPSCAGEREKHWAEGRGSEHRVDDSFGDFLVAEIDSTSYIISLILLHSLCKENILFFRKGPHVKAPPRHFTREKYVRARTNTSTTG